MSNTNLEQNNNNNKDITCKGKKEHIILFNDVRVDNIYFVVNDDFFDLKKETQKLNCDISVTICDYAPLLFVVYRYAEESDTYCYPLANVKYLASHSVGLVDHSVLYEEEGQS